ncbi:hypothetical protein KO498_09975 [Lentibacter algarum]|uniref:hypothetical protein n=1 Tax=Lentibacter algarum TaxID=576131 RepID=UPI001C065AE5|nr:hypothetical protein [Lentibacter algarum]MBU2982138.1 hypothetical protein [Lentibacter algarum]
MSLKEALIRAKTEEDVKDAYIAALGLKGVNKGLVDIQTNEIWFEAKEAATPPLLMFAQLMVYVRAARKRGEPIPGFLCVIDREKAALMATEHALPLLEDKNIVWPKSGSAADMVFAAKIAPVIETHFVLYQIEDYEEEFIKATKDAISEGRIIRTPITPDNLRQVFDKWVAMVGVELGVENEADYAVLFFADIMHDGRDEAMRNLPARLLFSGNKPVFIIGADQYELASESGYRNFWNIYHRPPEKEHRHYLLERRDSLLPMDDQKFKGAFYTPLHIVDKAYDQLTATLGKNWQKKYIVWDMCAGVGNLEAKHSNLRNVYMSTLDPEDVTIMRSNPAFAGAGIFQYDYLNDDVDDFGQIDYDLSGKLPLELRQAIADTREGKKGAKPILVLINPPYAEATGGGHAVPMAKSENKLGVANTQFARTAMEQYGKATNELFMQFIARAYQEIPKAKLAIFSKVKYISTPTLNEFRDAWRAEYLGGFAVHSKAFEGLKGNFPISFFIWDTASSSFVRDVTALSLDKNGNQIGEKTYLNYDGRELLTDWVVRPPSNKQTSIPLKGAIIPATSTADLRGTRWSDDAVAWLNCAGNDFQNAVAKTFLMSSGYGSARGFFVTAENLWQAAVVFAVRLLIKPTWLNDRDQFLQATQPLSDEFKSDCLVWMLFNGSNLTAGADGLNWNGRDWSLTNHFIPFTEAQVGANARFESDFMVQYMTGMAFSPEALAVLDEGRKLFQRFHAIGFPNKIRLEFKLGRADAGWYQVRRALEAYSDTEITDFAPFKAAYADLTTKLRPQVFDLGFLPS